MANLTNNKTARGLHTPIDAIETEWKRLEPMVTPKRIRDHFLWGLPLKSFQTGQAMTDEILAEKIEEAVPELEELFQLVIASTQIDERQEFDRNLYQTMGYMQLRQKPITGIQSLAVSTSNDQQLWQISNDWIDRGRLHEGLIYIVPINVAVAPSSGNGGAAGGAAFLALLGQQSWVPAYWRVVYTVGWDHGAVPRLINTLIGLQASIAILHQLGATNASSNSKSLGIGGLSQSSSNAGPNIYAAAIEGMEKRRDAIGNKIRSKLGGSFFVTSM